MLRRRVGVAVTATPGGTRQAGSVFRDDLGLRRDDLLATVITVGRDVVAQVRLARGRVGRQLLGAQRVVGAAHAFAGRGNAGFLHSHGIAPASIRNSVKTKFGDASQLLSGFNAASAAKGLLP